jgi:hypothetical protein
MRIANGVLKMMKGQGWAMYLDLCLETLLVKY